MKYQNLIAHTLLAALSVGSISAAPVGNISTVPVTITTPGVHTVLADLTQSGAVNAITIAASGVTIDFAGHSLSLSSDGGQGIVTTGNQNNITVKNGTIVGPLSSTIPFPSAGAEIYFNNVQGGVVDNMVLKNGFFGVLIDNSSDVKVTNSFITEFFGADVNMRVNNNGITLEDCVFKNTFDFQLLVGGINVGQFAGLPTEHITYPPTTNYDIAIRNCQHVNADILIGASTTRGIRIDNVQSVLNDNTYPFTMFEIGFQVDDVNSDIIVTNSSFSNIAQDPNKDTSGVAIFAANNVLFDNVAIECNNYKPSDTLGSDGLPLSSAGACLIIGQDEEIGHIRGHTTVHNMTVQNCIFSGGSLDGHTIGQTLNSIKIVAPQGSQNTDIVIKDSAIADAVLSLIDASGLIGGSFRNNNLVNADTGINFHRAVVGGNVDGNIVRDNAFSNLNTGVSLDAKTTNTGIVENTFTKVGVEISGLTLSGKTNFADENRP